MYCTAVPWPCGSGRMMSEERVPSKGVAAVDTVPHTLNLMRGVYEPGAGDADGSGSWYASYSWPALRHSERKSQLHRSP